MDFLQQYASLRHQEDRLSDIMAEIVTLFSLQGWQESPAVQTLRNIAWVGPDGGGVTIAVAKEVTFSHLNVEGQSVYTQAVTPGKVEILREVDVALDHLCALFGIEDAEDE